MQYRFYVNVEKDEQGRHVGFFGYKQGHALELAYTGEVEAISDSDALNQLFETFNINHPANYRNRSMSVGDAVVLIDESQPLSRTYVCEPVGWKEIGNYLTPRT
jgi:hypothetical protein